MAAVRRCPFRRQRSGRIALVRAAREAADAFGAPLDLEWAIEEDGTIRFLQARPVTELVADRRELDYMPSNAHVYTLCNVSEVIPARSRRSPGRSPRAASTTGSNGSTTRSARSGRSRKSLASSRCSSATSSSISTIADIGRFVAGASAERSCVAICGRPIPEVRVRENAPFHRRAWNGAKYAKVVFSSDAYVATLESVVARLAFPSGPDSRALVAAIRAAADDYDLAFAMHLGASARSGAFTTALLDTIAKGRTADERDHAEVARLLAGASEVESHDLADGLDRIADRIATRRGFAERFVRLPSDEGLVLLRSIEAGDVADALALHLTRHGHRCVRELELRQ